MQTLVSAQERQLYTEIVALKQDGYIYTLCYRILREEQAAEDAASDVFLLSMRYLESFRGNSSVKTWLFHIIRNHCLNCLRNRARQNAGDDIFVETADASAPLLQEDVENRVLYQQLWDAVMRKAKSRRPPWDSDDYLIFEHYYRGEKKTWPQIATLMNKPEARLKDHYYRHVLPCLQEVGEECERVPASPLTVGISGPPILYAAVSNERPNAHV